MIVFRCSHCSKVNFSTEGYCCFHCGNEERVPSISEKHTDRKSTSINNNDVFSHIQNISIGTDVSVLSQTSERLNVAKLQENDAMDKHTKTMNINRSHISSLQEEPESSNTQNFILKERITSSRQTACSNTFYSTDNSKSIPSTKFGTSVPKKKMPHISEKPSCHKPKKNLNQKKTVKHKITKSRQNTNTIRKLNFGRPLAISTEKSKLDPLTNNGSTANHTKDNQAETNSTGKLSNKKINRVEQDDLKTIKASTLHSSHSFRDVSCKGCSENDFNEKFPIKRVRIPIECVKKFFLCNKCGKSFITESKLNVHFLKHFKEKLFKCDQCDKEYFSECHLKRHNKVHMQKDPLKCDLCDAIFFRNCHLSRHRKKHILAPSVDSSATQQRVVQSSQQREQETSDVDDPQIHFEAAAEEVFLCTECGIKFVRESDFKTHSLRHKVQKPFKCKYCDKEFRYESNLNRHCRIHTLERPFICKICGFNTNQRGNLSKHLKLHA